MLDHGKLITHYEKVGNLVALRLAELVNQAFHQNSDQNEGTSTSSILNED